MDRFLPDPHRLDVPSFEHRELAALIDETAPEARRAFFESLSAPSAFGALDRGEP